jgi:glycosyltransferase involved in cell wall biosynthesis
MPRQPEVSLCVHTYLPNEEGYFEDRVKVIDRCLHSLTYTMAKTDFELIIWCNGSITTFREYYLMDNWSNHTLILSKDNVGAYRARRRMFHMARGKYLMFTDDDVEFLPGWFEKQKQVIEAYPWRPIVVGGTPETPNWKLATFTKQVIDSGQLKAVGEGWVTHNGVKAQVGSNHMQFLTVRDSFPNYPEPESNRCWHWASSFDMHLVGFRTMGLNTADTVVRHWGRGETYED